MPAKTIQYVRPPLYPKQRAFVDCTARYTVVEASTKAGKTVSCLVWILERAMSGRPAQSYWWVAPTYAVSGIAFDRLKRYLSGGLPRDYWKTCESEQAIELANGTKIWFKGADKPDSLYGEDVYAAVMDEATRCKQDSWYAVRSTLTATNGPIKIIGNVRGRRNWAYLLARKAEAGAPNMAHFRLTAYDAVEGGILPMSEVEDAQAMLPDSVFKELYLAEPADDGGNPFGIAAIARCSDAISGLSTGDPVCFGIDLAKSVDYTVVVGMDSDRMVCRLERWQSDWSQTKRRILQIVGNKPALVDSTGVGDPVLEDLNREQHRIEGFKFSSTSKQQIMEGLSAAIQRQGVAFPSREHPEHGWLVNELESFEYEYRSGGVRYTAPAGLHDDGVCALALACQAFRGMENRISFDPSMFALVTSSN